MSITYETPGVYIEEITGPGVIQGVSTSVAGFVGPTASRHVDRGRVTVTSFDQFMERFAAPGAPAPVRRAEEPVVPVRSRCRASSRTAAAEPTSRACRTGRRQRRADEHRTAASRRSCGRATRAPRATRSASPPSRALGPGGWPPRQPRSSARHRPRRPAGFPPEAHVSSTSASATAGFVAGDEVQIVLPPRPRSRTTRATSVVGRQHVSTCCSSASSGTGAAAHLRGQRPSGRPRHRQHRQDHGHADHRRAVRGDCAGDGRAAVEHGGASTGWCTSRCPLVTSPGTAADRCGRGRQPADPGAVAGQPSRDPDLRRQRPAGRARHGRERSHHGSADGGRLPTTSRSPSPRASRQRRRRFAWVVDPPTAPVVDNPGDQRSDVAAPVTADVVASPSRRQPHLHRDRAARRPPARRGVRPDHRHTDGRGTTTVTVTATDANGNAGQATFDWETVGPGADGRQPWSSGHQRRRLGQRADRGAGADRDDGLVRRHQPPGRTLDRCGHRADLGRGHRRRGPATSTVTVTAGGVANVRFAWVVPAPVFATVERAQGRWLLVAPPDGSTADPAWPGVLAQVILSLLDYPPDRAGIRLEVPTAPDSLPAVGTWVEAGAGSDSVAFRIDRVSSTGVVTVGRREPADREISLRLAPRPDLALLRPRRQLADRDDAGRPRTCHWIRSATATCSPRASCHPVSSWWSSRASPCSSFRVGSERRSWRWRAERISTSTRWGARTINEPSTCFCGSTRSAWSASPTPPATTAVDRVTRRTIQNAQLTHCLRIGRPDRDLRPSAGPPRRPAPRGRDRQRGQRPAVRAGVRSPLLPVAPACIDPRTPPAAVRRRCSSRRPVTSPGVIARTDNDPRRVQGAGERDPRRGARRRAPAHRRRAGAR